MPNTYDKPFSFKQFEVYQSRSAMKVGTDAVLLGAWVNLTDIRYMLDVGTGTGVIALICAQRNPDAIIEAIEIDPGSAEDARHNFQHSPWSSRLKMHEGDFLKTVAGEKFDLIISNPPYFTSSLRHANPSRNAARHDDALPAESFLPLAVKLLRPEGRLALILPSSEIERWINEAAKNRLFPFRVCHVFTLAHKDPSRIMIEFSPGYEGEPRMESLLIEKSPGEITEAYKQLIRDFYLKW